MAELSAANCPLNSQSQNLKAPQWTGSRMELIELFYALHEAKCFSGTSLKALFASIGKMFGCEITNYYRLFWDVKNRTAEERTFFLNSLKKALSDKLIRMDSLRSLSRAIFIPK
ncbi:RteC domain-containing protein [Viscerimonas tarda]